MQSKAIMDKEVIFIRLEPKLKYKVRKLAEGERRSVTSFVLSLIDKKISEAIQDDR
jgi:hypothetical protein